VASLPEELSGLLEAGAYPHPVRRLELVQTHISWVLLTGDYAYKIKRPVCYPFVDLRSASRRHDLCCEELRLNRRFAADLYLEVCPIVRRDGRARMGGEGAVLEHAVRMRQFSRDQELDQLLHGQRVEPRELHAFGMALADIHGSLPRAAAHVQWGSPATIAAAVTSNLEQAIAAGAGRYGTQRTEALRSPFRDLLCALEPWMRMRRETGHVRECHGDLHCRNIVRWEGALHGFDCLEFEPAFRWIDVAQEIAFLLADLDARAAAGHAHAFIGGYLARSGDYAACRGIPLYQAHCALVRAKVMALAEEERAAGRCDFADFLAAAERSLSPRRGVLVLVTGLSGSGKTWLAGRLAARLGAIHLQSDVERKRLAGLEPGARSRSALGSDLYSPQATDALYAHLAQCAGDVLAAGWPVIVDATFVTRGRRAAMRDLAGRLGIPVHVIACRAPTEILRGRVRRRAALGTDASEADASVLEWQLQHAEPLQPEEGLQVLDVDTSVEISAPTLDDLALRCGAPDRLRAAPRQP
jgi:aminoglycoside phosphotransferase family enzyme/predicted kinase